HPPISGGGGAIATPAEPAEGHSLVWDVPGDWRTETPQSALRRAQYRVPGAAGDGECVVFYFGPGQGGDPQANALRWAQQFSQPDGRDSRELMQLAALPGAALATQIVEVTGTYNGGMTGSDEPARPQPGSMLLGAIVQGPDAPWFFKLTGPAATLRAQREAFLKMVGSARAGGA
ncbi:MAG TPA: hypothetical protein VJS92_17370, partial [Candidatus Polarisedimenticolaceae bacterium]|nr:hypothetical protein [Candidatus Polarisedimenticolaceae bacterium]